ncbi:unnamed protein product [Microthlaspi erraticum]|uniref:Uncharacterized protein n=1 Tax=Microthlaspi erraticum TaxID=1685480 RepID=A0A6D2IUQ5_9BRAS|nr:unnamed protein product [Microthlaspi erraticum]
MAALQKESSSALTQSLRLSRENQVLVAEKDNVARRVMSFGANWNIAYHWRLVEEGKTLSAPCTDSSTGSQSEEGRSHLEDQSSYSTNRSSSSTRPAKLQLDRAEESKSNPKNVASPLTSFDPKPNLVLKALATKKQALLNFLVL